jgi:molecular chaperone GrpE
MATDEKLNASVNKDDVNKKDEKLKEQTGEKSEVELLKEENENLRKELEEYKDKLLRKVAEFENYRKRLESDFSNAVKYANEKLLLQMLPVIDDLERSLEAGRKVIDSGRVERRDYESFYQGVKMIYSKLMKVLESHGVKPFDSIGKPFDVYYHDALMRVPRDDVPPDTVIDEVERGYMFYDKVLRHAKVIVSSQISREEKKDEDKDGGKSFSPEDLKGRDDHRDGGS